jgi:hypothetical protein
MRPLARVYIYPGIIHPPCLFIRIGIFFSLGGIRLRARRISLRRQEMEMEKDVRPPRRRYQPG